MKKFLVSITFSFLLQSAALSQASYNYNDNHCGGYAIGFNETTITNSFLASEVPLYTNATSLTLCAWIQPTVTMPSGREMGIVYRKFFVNSLQRGWVEYGIYLNAKGELMFRGNIAPVSGGPDKLDSLSSGYVPQKGTWCHVAATFDEVTYTCMLYANGQLVATKKMEGPLAWKMAVGGNYDPMTIAAVSISNGSYFATSGYFQGFIDDVLFSVKPLNKAQIDSVASAPPNETFAGSSTMTVFDFYRFNEGRGNSIKSFQYVYSNSGYGYTAYPGGSPGWVFSCAANKPPVANAGLDKTITLPTNSVTLDGSSSTDPDGTIVKYEWTKVSGPSSGGGTISSSQSVITSVTGLNEGTYVFRLTVTDNSGGKSSDEVQVTVNPGNKYITIANLRIYGDNIPPTGNPRKVYGNVYIVPKESCTNIYPILHFDGNVEVDTVLNTISGTEKIYCSNVGTIQNINLYSSPYKLYVVNDLLSWNLGFSSPSLLSLLKLAFLDTYIKNIKVLCDGIQINSKVSLPKGVYKTKNSNEREYDITIDNLYLTYKGIDLAGGVKLSGLTYKGLMGLDNLELNYNYKEDEFTGKIRALAYLFNLDASAKIKNALLSEVNFGIAAGMIPLPSFYGWGIDSVGGGAKDLDKDTVTWNFGARITPVVKYAVKSFGNLRINGTYRLGTIYSGGATYTMFNQNVVGGELTYRAANKTDTAGSITLKGNLDLFKVLKGDAVVSINTNQYFSKLVGTSNMSLNIPKFEGYWKFLNRLYPSGEIFSSSNYFSNDYLAGTVRQNSHLVPRLFYVLNWKNGWEWDWAINSSVVPLEAQTELNFRTARNLRASGLPLIYSFVVNVPTQHVIIKAKGKSIPNLSVYLTNGDTLNINNYQRHNNVLYLADTLDVASIFIITNPPQGGYYVWSTDADGIEVRKTNQLPKIIINNVADNKSLKKFTVTYTATDPDDNAKILFGFDRDKTNTNGLILQDSVSENSSTGTITLDYSKINSGVYYLYSSITDSIGQNEYFYYGNPFKIIAKSAPNAPSNLSVQATDSSLIFKFIKNNQVSCNYLIHYNDNSNTLDLNTNNFAIGDTNFIEIINLPAGKSYQFAVTAIDSNINESDLSNIVSIFWKSPKINNAPTFKTGNILSKIKVGESYSSSITAADPDGDILTYTLIKGPVNAKINNLGIVSWIPDKLNLGYNEFCVNVTDNRGGLDSLCFNVLVYNSLIAAPNVAFNKTSFDSYTEKPLIEVTDLLADKSGDVSVKVFSSSDPLGIIISAKRIGDQISSFVSEISLTNGASTTNSVKVLKGDTLWIQYTNVANNHVALNYSLFNYLKADFLFKDSACSSDGTKFYNASKGSNLTYEWDFGDGSFSSEINPNHTFLIQSGKSKYTVKLKITNGQNSSDTISKIVSLKSGVASIVTTGKTNMCIGDSLILVSSNTSNNQWYRNDTLIVGAIQSSYTVKQSGNYSVRISQTNCPAFSSPVTVTVDPIPPTPTVSLSGQPGFCSGDSITLTSSSATGNQWYKDGNEIAGATNKSFVVKTTGSYTVKTTANGCSSGSSSAVVPSILQLPNGSITAASTSICPGSNTQLSASGGNTYQWYKDAQQIAGANASNYTATASGVYSADVISSNGCKAKASNSITLTTLNKPKAGFSFDSYCLNIPVTFTNTTSGSNISYQWNFGDNQTSANISPQHSYSKIGSYTVSLVASLKDCSNSNDTLQTTIKIEAPLPGIKYPLVSATYGRPQQLSARNIGRAYQWIPPTDLDNARSRTPVLTPTGDRKYAIRITTLSGCITTDSLEIAFLKDIKVLVPTAFAPNGNGSNDVLRPVLLNIVTIKYFRVYNRWGQLVYETKTINEGWNGNYQGKPQPMETYTWVFEGTDIQGTPVKISGKSVLLR